MHGQCPRLRSGDRTASYCFGPARNELRLAGGAAVGGEGALGLLSYRRFLGDWSSGRLHATLGADVNIAGLEVELIQGILDQPAPERSAKEFGSVMGGVDTRLGGWGGTAFGGIGFRFETGLGVGRFNLRPATPGAPERSSVEPSWILQVGPRAEFLVPDFTYGGRSGGLSLPISIGVAYRGAVPLNADAEMLHGLMGTIDFGF